MSTNDSHNIQVDVKTTFLDAQSNRRENRFVYGYTITIKNLGDKSAQLISRHWIITDGNQGVQEVKGIGVIGEQPTIQPGESYTYSSGAVLPTETGLMTGSYTMLDEDGETFSAPIPAFPLIPPNKLH